MSNREVQGCVLSSTISESLSLADFPLHRFLDLPLNLVSHSRHALFPG